jgi:hypothetical protein
MSAWPGKVHILGVREVGGQQAFVLEYLQSRRPELVRRPFFARFDPTATWFDQLEPLTEADAPMWPDRWIERNVHAVSSRGAVAVAGRLG